MRSEVTTRWRKGPILTRDFLRHFCYPSGARGGEEMDPRGRRLRRERGSTLLETAVACAVLLAMVFGVFEMSLALYTYHYISDAAREGSRYAIVRGSNSCTNTPNIDNCNATPAQIQTYVQNLGYPGINSTHVNTSWLSASTTQPTTWSACATPCKAPGNLVKVNVTYAFPLAIPFWRAVSLNLSSTSQMVISQ